jgi:hypothetical protein
LSRDVDRGYIPELLRRLDEINVTPAVPRDLPESVGELAALPPLWREAIVGAVIVNATLVVIPTAITDRNRATITAALTLLQVEMLIKSP